MMTRFPYNGFIIESSMIFTKLPVQLDDGAHMPTYAHTSDAGMDLYAMNRCVIPPHGSAVFDTGVHVAIPEGFCGLIVSKSGLNINHGLTSDGLIDSGMKQKETAQAQQQTAQAQAQQRI